MRVCIVGQGPSANGHAKLIDGCDFVVRIKAYWECGAEDAGDKIDAWAHYGHPIANPAWEGTPPKIEHWVTHCPGQFADPSEPGGERHSRAVAHANGQPMRILTDTLWWQLRKWLNRHPSTGMVAAAMAIHALPLSELVLVGFDSTTRDRPNYLDAQQHAIIDSHPHDMLTEKKALGSIADGFWLGAPTKVKLTWPNKPKLGGGASAA